DIRLRAFGPENSGVASASVGLAMVLTAQGNHAEARSHFASSLKIQEQSFGPRAPQVAYTLERFANLLHQMKDIHGAAEMESRAKSIRAELNYTVRAPVDRSR